MRTEYKRDMNHNYLILYGDEQLDTDSYQVRMLLGNAVPSLLKCRIQGIDGQFMLYYDITSRQSVISLYEQKKFRAEDLRLILGGIIQTIEEMEEYLMNPGQLLLQPEYMYLDVEKKKLYFCCMPGKNEDIKEQFRIFTEYILPQIDHEEEEAVILGYGVYRRTLEGTFHLEYIKEEIYKEREEVSTEKQENVVFNEKKQCQELFFEEKMQEEKVDFFRDCEEKEEEKERYVLWKKIAFCLLGALGFFLILAAGFFGYLPEIQVKIVMLAMVAAGGIGMLAYKIYTFVLRKRKNPIDFASEIPVEKEVEQEKTNRKQKKFVKVEQTEKRDFGETVVLSANTVEGPATLVSREPGELAAIYLQEEITVIGKMETAVDAVIDLPTVSRIHAKIRRQENEYYLSDLNSRNGTTVNGRLLQEGEDYHLQHEDEVDFAQARYVFLK